MSEKRNARFVAATTERAEAATFGGVAASSGHDCTTSTETRQVVSAALLTGAENAIEGRLWRRRWTLRTGGHCQSKLRGNVAAASRFVRRSPETVGGTT